MRQMFKSMTRRSRRFNTDTDGAVTVEAAIWLPFFIMFTFGIAEMALVFHGQARALQVAQDANRAFTIGEFADTAETSAWIKDRLSSFSSGVKTKTEIDSGLITTTIAIPADDLARNIGIFSVLTEFDVVVTSQQVVEF